MCARSLTPTAARSKPSPASRRLIVEVTLPGTHLAWEDETYPPALAIVAASLTDGAGRHLSHTDGVAALISTAWPRGQDWWLFGVAFLDSSCRSDDIVH